MIQNQKSVTLPTTTSFYYDPTNVNSPVTPLVLGQTVIPDTVCWINLSLNEPNLATFLTTNYRLSQNIAKGLCDTRLKPRMWNQKDSLLFSLIGFITPALDELTAANINLEAAVLNALPQMTILNLYLSHKILITTSSFPSWNYDKLFNTLQIDAITTPQGVSCVLMTYMLYQIEDAIANMQQSLINIEAHIDKVSIKLMNNEIWEIRKQIIEHLHHFHVQEDMLSQIFYQKPLLLSEADYTYFKNIVSNLDHCAVAMRATEQLAVALQAKIDSVANDAMSRKLYLLSILALFIAPFTVIGGLIGMNVHIPGQTQPYAFEFLVGSCLLISIILFIIFRLKKWL